MVFSRFWLAVPVVAVLTGVPAGAQQSAQVRNKGSVPVTVPVFRHIDPSRSEPVIKPGRRVRFLAASDFPPMSYTSRDGKLSGFNVAIASNICRVFRMGCSFKAVPYDMLVPALLKGQGDAIITGIAATKDNIRQLDFTLPYMRFTARFAVRINTPFKATGIREMAGKRIGVIAASQHEAFIKKYYRRSKTVAFKQRIEAYEALRTGRLDALFDDSFALMFWINGEKSLDCCRFAGDGYVDPHSFSRPVSMAVKKGKHDLRAILDYGLDRLQVSGRFAAIYRQYFPASLWRGN